MFSAERRQRILAVVRSNGAVSVRELAGLTGTSEVTVRRDLRQLEADGQLARHHGGAVMVGGGTAHEPSYTEKAQVAAEEKAAIADAAISLVEDGDAVIVGAGTTTQAFARRLSRFRELTVVTNSLAAAQVLSRARGVEVFVTGGHLRGPINALVGGQAEHVLAQMRTPKAFLSGNGLTFDHGLSTPNIVVANVDRAIAAAARELIVLADHTKIGQDAMVQTVPTSHISTLVTDKMATAEQLHGFRKAGVQVIVAKGG